MVSSDEEELPRDRDVFVTAHAARNGREEATAGLRYQHACRSPAPVLSPGSLWPPVAPSAPLEWGPLPPSPLLGKGAGVRDSGPSASAVSPWLGKGLRGQLPASWVQVGLDSELGSAVPIVTWVCWALVGWV